MGNRFARQVNKEAIREEVKEHPVVMYTKSACSYCTKAKSLLHGQNIPFEEKSLDSFQREKPDEYQAYVNGLLFITQRNTVPQIFICGKFIGGFYELSNMHKTKRLLNAIEECAPPEI